MTSSIFEPALLGPHQLKNRIVMNPMTRSRADVDAVPTPIMATYYGQRDTAGMIITEGIAPSPNGRGYARIPGLWNDTQVAAWKPVTTAAKAKGAVVFAQLMHTGRVSHPSNMPAGAKIVAPSAIALAGQMYTDADGMQDYPVPQEMTEADIQQAKAEIVTAAKNAIAAGFDGVELHSANGYLLEQFLSPDTNKRTDGWGGSVAKRSRFLLEVAQEVVAAIGGDKVGIRISPYGTASGMAAYAEVDETYLALMAALDKIGLVYVHLVDHAAMGNPAIPADFRAKLRAAWPRTFIVGGSLDAASAQAAVDAGAADLVGFGRAFLANPDLVARMQTGAELNAPDFATFYTPGEKGYTDYPTLG
ncbi:alkene reductase [Cypionkella sp.]|uniref:alkene reductase n=1 Tax=Cypionkella sp. TaxID=2811411 RepID=UPI002603ACAF|nr:alkene reductase [Cypionkella sp.]MDB5664365.1 NADH:flavin oxidoreductase/NADH oxidase [Cypionkella sp.]